MGKFNWSVVSVTPLDGHVLELEFHDGTRGTYDARQLLEWPVYEKLRDKAFFSRCRAEHGTVVWDDDIDIAPERLYEGCTAL